jgi:large subunit ribosomal protein L10
VANQEKTAAVAEITERFQGSSAAVLTEYRGLTMAQMTQLRRSLGATTTYAVVKNTLTKLAAAEVGYPVPTELLTGPTAIAFVGGDPVEAAKGLRDFAKTNPLLVVKGGVLDGRKLSAEEFTKLADLESREVLLAKLAGGMKAKMSQAAATFNALPTQLARLAQALVEKKAAEGGAEAPAADAPAAADAEAPAADA